MKQSKAQILGEVINMVDDGFDFIFMGRPKMSKVEMKKQIKWFSNWLKEIRDSKDKTLKN